MKVKTSITLSEELLRAIDEQAGAGTSRSAFIERAVRIHLAQIARERRDARDIEIMNREAEQLNREAEDVLTYQVIP